MKFLASFILLSQFVIQSASAFSLTGNPAIDRILGNAGNIRFGNSVSSSGAGTLSASECLTALEEAKNLEETNTGVFYLQTKIPERVLKISNNPRLKATSEFGGEVNIGLDPSVELLVNSYNARFAPHLKSGCLKETNILGSEVRTINDRECLAVGYELAGSDSYYLIYCPGERQVFTQF